MTTGVANAAVQVEPVETSRRERRKNEVRSRIIHAAIALIDQKGFEAAMVSEICERADVAQKTFFNYFASKQHLLSEIARVEMKILIGRIDAARGADGAAAGIERFFRALAERIEVASPMRRELLTEMVHVGHDAGPQARTLHQAFRGLLRGDAAGRAAMRGVDLDAFTEIVVGTFYALMFNWANFEGYPFRKRAMAAARMLGQLAAGTREGERQRRKS